MNHEQLQRFLMPRRGEPRDVRALYLVEPETTGASSGRITFDGRFSVSIPAGSEVSFQSYFNAFPASYWRRWSQLDSVLLKVTISGTARVDVYRSRLDGGSINVAGAELTDDVAEFDLTLAPFEDGGWYWFDVTAETDTVITEAGWFAAAPPGPQTLPDGTTVGPFPKKVTVGIPTFNRPADAVAALEALASDPEVDAAIEAILLPDQGTAHPADEPGYAAVTEHFGERFFEFRQGNLGGSGGYSRIMFEALGGAAGEGALAQAGIESPYILYMDDDIAIEPDSVLRAVQVARYARSPIVVGGQMLNLLKRSELRTMGEVVGRGDFMWAPAPHVTYDHDFAKHPLGERREDDKPDSRDLHRRIDVDFNGWWMCLFPRVVAKQIGQPLPLFIKWDDTEYSLRAGAAGYPTATWPGVAIWHMSWADKDDAIDWQAYFHLRNRLIVAALYHDGPTRGLARSLMKSTLKHAMCLEYSTLAIQNEALRDVLAGPEHLFEILESALPRVNNIRKQFTDAQVQPSATALPAPSGPPPGLQIGDPRPGLKTKAKKLRWFAQGVRHLLQPVDPAALERPQVNLAKDEARWFNLFLLDGATVTTADGKGVTFRKRDSQQVMELVKENLALQKEIMNRFDELRVRYRAALPELTSRESWKQVFDAQ